MRAYTLAFALLAVIAVTGGRLSISSQWQIRWALVAAFAGLSVVAFWRMRDHSVSLERHVFTRFLEKQPSTRPISRSA